jgi:hypothetical protein
MSDGGLEKCCSDEVDMCVHCISYSQDDKLNTEIRKRRVEGGKS